MTISRPERVPWESANRDQLVAELTVIRARLRAHACPTAPQDAAVDAASDAFPDGVPALADAERALPVRSRRTEDRPAS